MDPKTGEVSVPEDEILPQSIEEKVETLPFLQPRINALAEIARRRAAEVEKDNNDFTPDIMDEDGNITPAPKKAAAEEASPPTEEDAGKLPASVDAQPAEEPAVDDSSKPAPLSAAPRMFNPDESVDPKADYTVIVNGQSTTVKGRVILDNGFRAFSKDSSADLKLAAASRMEQQAREAYARSQQLPQGAGQFQQPPHEQQQEAILDDASLANALQYGNSQDAASAINQLRRQGRGVTPQDLTQLVSQSLASSVPEHINFHNANAWVRDQHAEIFSNPMLEQQFMIQEQAARNAGDRRSYRELYADIASSMATSFNLKGPSPTPAADSAGKIERKIAAPKAPPRASGRVTGAAEVKPKTTAEWVQEQRTKRGFQPQI